MTGAAAAAAAGGTVTPTQAQAAGPRLRASTCSQVDGDYRASYPQSESSNVLQMKKNDGYDQCSEHCSPPAGPGGCGESALEGPSGGDKKSQTIILIIFTV